MTRRLLFGVAAKVVCSRRQVSGVTMKRHGWAVWVFLGLFGHFAAFPHAAAAQAAATETEAQARDAFERGRIHYDNGDFARAAEAFEQAYKLSGREGLLYNIYLAYRDANEQEKAAEALRAYLTKVEVIENRPQLEARLSALDAGIAQRKQAAAQAEREREAREKAEREAAEAPQVAPETASPERGRWWLTPVAIMGAGGVIMAGSIATGVMSNKDAKKLEDQCPNGDCAPSLKSTGDRGKTLAAVTDGLLFGGLAVAVVGGVLLLLKRPKSAEREEMAARPSVSCTRTSCSGSVTLRF